MRRPLLSRSHRFGIEPLESRIAPATVLAVTENNTLLRFDHLTPTVIDAVTPVTGLGAGETLTGVDFDPFTGVMAGLTVDANGTGRFYTIEPTTGAAVLVSTLNVNPADRTNPFTSLTGEHFSWGFSEDEPGAIRLISDVGQNLRVAFSSGQVRTDATLTNPDLHLGEQAPRFLGLSTLKYRTPDSESFQVIDTSSQALVLYTMNADGETATRTWLNSVAVNPSGLVGMDFDTWHGNQLISLTENGVTQLVQHARWEPEIEANTIGDGTIPIRDIALVLNVWTGAGGDSNWSTAANWKANLAPAPQSVLLFPAGAARLTNVNDFPAGTEFNTIRLEAAGYVLSGYEMLLRYSLHVSGGEATIETDVALLEGAHAKWAFLVDVAESSRLTFDGTVKLNGNSLYSGHTGTIEFDGTVLNGTLNSHGLITLNEPAGADVTLMALEEGNFEIRNPQFVAPVLLLSQSSLSGTGQIGDLNVNDSSVSPGRRDIGTLTIQGTLSMSSGATLHVDLFGTGNEREADRLVVTGLVGISGRLQLNAASDDQSGAQFVLIDNQGKEPVWGHFDGQPEGSIISAGEYRYWITYQGGDGNDVVLTQIPEPIISKNGRSAQFTDANGDRVTVTVSKGKLEPGQFQLRPTEHAGRYEFEYLNLTSASGAGFDRANITIKAVPQDLDKDGKKEGDGFVNLGQLQATGVNLSVVNVDGNLGGILAGDTSGSMESKPGVKNLQARGFGQLDAFMSDLSSVAESVIQGNLQTLSIRGEFAGASLEVTGKVGTLKIGGSISGEDQQGSINADLGIRNLHVAGSVTGEIRSDLGTLGKVEIRGDLEGTEERVSRIFGRAINSVSVKGSVVNGEVSSPGKLSSLSIGGDLRDSSVFATRNATFSGNRTSPFAISKVSIGGDMERSRILAGSAVDPKLGLTLDPDGGIGSVLIRGDFITSDIAAGIDPVNEFYGDADDLVMTSGGLPDVVSRIASVTIRGQAIGTSEPGDSYGIVAEQIGAMKIGKIKVDLTSEPGEWTWVSSNSMDVVVWEKILALVNP